MPFELRISWIKLVARIGTLGLMTTVAASAGGSSASATCAASRESRELGHAEMDIS